MESTGAGALSRNAAILRRPALARPLDETAMARPAMVKRARDALTKPARSSSMSALATCVGVRPISRPIALASVGSVALERVYSAYRVANRSSLFMRRLCPWTVFLSSFLRSVVGKTETQVKRQNTAYHFASKSQLSLNSDREGNSVLREELTVVVLASIYPGDANRVALSPKTDGIASAQLAGEDGGGQGRFH